MSSPPGAPALPLLPSAVDAVFEDDEDGDVLLSRDRWFAETHGAGFGESLPPDLLEREIASWKEWARERGPRVPITNAAGARWVDLGPVNITGRVLSVAFDPVERDVLYAGTAGGGFYRSPDLGRTWVQLGGDHLPSLWIGAIAIDPRDRNVIFAGTGETNNNAGGHGGFGGILRSTDGGATFAKIPINEGGFVRTWIARDDSNLVLLAAGGIWRSTTGGTTWTKVYSKTVVTDLIEEPETGRFVAAATDAWGNNSSAILESVDRGQTWRALPAVGLPSDNAQWGRSALAFNKRGELYLALGTKIGGSIPSALYRSTDGGMTFAKLAEDRDSSGYLGASWYGAHLDFGGPDGRTLVQNNGFTISMSPDEGVTWVRVKGDWHVDTHGVAFSPGDPNRVAVATDGGVAVSVDAGWTFRNKNVRMPTVQYQSCGLAAGERDVVYAGTQDNWMSVRRD